MQISVEPYSWTRPLGCGNRVSPHFANGVGVGDEAEFGGGRET